MTATLAPPSQTRERQHTAFRADIQGLRAIAVLLVVLYHAHVPGLRGGYVGVDVFFVISGFLITTQLLGEITRTGRIRFGAFYAKRMRRLLPSALLVIVVTVLVARLVAPPLQVKALVTQAVYAAFYAINYRLAAEGVDYQQASAAASPLQHFWSLAVEEQFYLLWPLLIAVTFLLARRYGRRAAAAVFALVFAISLYESITVTRRDTSLAYFALHTRAWELAAGALIAVAAARLRRLPAAAGESLAWTGLLAVIAGGFLYSDDTPFPGTAALLPVLGAAAVLAGGCAGMSRRLGFVLGRRPVQGIGKISYAWYLWHWPALLLLPLIYHRSFDWGRDLEAVGLALWLAVLTYYVIEYPTRVSRLKLPLWLGAGALGSAAAAGVALLVAASLPLLAGPGRALHVVTSQGSADPAYLTQVQYAINGSASIHSVPSNLTPDLASAAHDFPETSFQQSCQANYLVIDQGPCVFGDPKGKRTVALFGDSHMEQWEPAFAAAAKRAHWRVVSWTKSACPVPDVPVFNDKVGRVYTECQKWRDKTIDRLVALHPDLLFVSQSDSVTGKQFTDQVYADDTVATLDRFRTAGIRVEYMLDISYPAVDVPVCLSAHLTNATLCSRKNVAGYIAPRRSTLATTLAAHRYDFVDPQPWQCAPTVCPALVGNMMVYRDASHFTATYSRWLAPMVQPLLTTG